MPLNGSENIHEEGKEHKVPLFVLARSEQLHARIRSQRPVVVFAGTVDSLERLLVKQNDETVPPRDFVHQVHNNLILVIRKIGFPINRRQLELVRRHLVVSGFERNAKPVPGNLQLAHKLSHARRNRCEIMVIQLLVLRRIVPHKGTPGNHKVRAGRIQTLIHQEIFLLPPEI